LAFTVTSRGANDNGITDTASVSLSSATPSASSLYIAAAAVEENTTGGSTASTVSTPTGLSAGASAFQAIGTDAESSTDYQDLAGAWYSQMPASPAAMTLAQAGSNQGGTFWLALAACDITGHNAASPIAQTAIKDVEYDAVGAAPALSVAFGTGLTVGNLVIAAVAQSVDAGETGTPTPTIGGQAMTPVATNGANQYMQIGIYQRVITGAESNSTIAVAASGGSTRYMHVVFAAEIAAGSSGANPTPTTVTAAVNVPAPAIPSDASISASVVTAVVEVPAPTVTLYPQVIATGGEIGTSLGAANAQTLPTGSASGDLILVWVTNDNPAATNITASTGWATIFHTAEAGSTAIKHACFGRVLDGGANDTLTISGAAQDYCVSSALVRNHSVTNANIATSIKVGTAATATTGNANPPSLNTGTTNGWLWFASCGVDFTTGNTISADPSTYTNVDNRTSASSTSSCGQRVARLAARAQTEDPGTFTNTSRAWVANTIAIPPPATAVSANPTPTVVTAAVSVPTPTSITAGTGVNPTATVVTATVSVPAPTRVAAGTAGFPFAVSSNSRYIVDGDGDPWFMAGDAAWGLIANVTYADAEAYLISIGSSYGANTVMVSLIEGHYSNNPGSNQAGDPAYSGTMFQSTPDADYWAHVDAIVVAAESLGITILAFPAYLGYGTDGLAAEVNAASNAQMQAYGEFLGQRYANSPNIIWCAGGDRGDNLDATNLARTDAMMTGIRMHAPHLMTAHGQDETTADGVFGAYSWLDLNNAYNAQRLPLVQSRTAYSDTPTRPAFFIEGQYEQDPQRSPVLANGALMLRTQEWAPQLAGMVGHVYGNDPRWYFGDTWGGPYGGGTWQESLSHPAGDRDVGTLHFAYFASFWRFNTFPWWELVPDTTDTFLTAGEGSGETQAAAAFGATSGYAVVYAPSNVSITLDLTELDVTSNVRIRRYDPTAGTYTTVGTYATTGSQSITHPGNNTWGHTDWVYLVEPAPAAPTVVTAAVVIPSPAVSIPVAVSATVVTASVSVPAPTVTGGSIASPTVVTAAVVVPSPTVAAAAVAAPTVVTAAVSVPTPTVSGAATATPVVVTAAVVVPSPSVSAASGSTATPTVVTAAVEVPSATVAGAAAVSPTVVTVTVDVPAPSVSAGTGTTATPSVVTAAVVVLSPTVTGAAVVAAAVVTAAVVVPSPTVSAGAGAAVSATVVTATVAVLSPTVSAGTGAAVSATVVTATVDIPTPTVSGAATAAPSVVTAAAEVPTPAISAGGSASITATTVTATVSVPSPTVSAASSATANPTVITAAVDIPAPSVTGGAAATPSVVTAPVDIPTPTVTTVTGAVPSVITLVTEVPTPTVTTGGGAAVTTSVVTATAVIPTPTITVAAGTSVTATVVTATVVIPTPSVGVTEFEPPAHRTFRFVRRRRTWHY
jgi:hypothetical protein